MSADPPIHGPKLNRLRLECYAAALELDAIAVRLEAKHHRRIGKALNAADALTEFLLRASAGGFREISPADNAVLVSLAQGYQRARRD